jgi:hypothetical protein
MGSGLVLRQAPDDEHEARNDECHDPPELHEHREDLPAAASVRLVPLVVILPPRCHRLTIRTPGLCDKMSGVVSPPSVRTSRRARTSPVP